METFVSSKSKIYIITNQGEIRKPDISEVEFVEDNPYKNKIKFHGAVTDEKIKKCSCNNDEIILEKTSRGPLKIHKAYNADPQLYKVILQLATSLGCGLEIGKLENLKDLFYLDKIVEAYFATLKKNLEVG
jgi:hypothetical protein